MSDYLDAVEVLENKYSNHQTVNPTFWPKVIAALLKACDSDQVTIWREKCETCDGKGYLRFPDYTETCDTCNGTGGTYRVAGLERRPHSCVHCHADLGTEDVYRRLPPPQQEDTDATT